MLIQADTWQSERIVAVTQMPWDCRDRKPNAKPAKYCDRGRFKIQRSAVRVSELCRTVARDALDQLHTLLHFKRLLMFVQHTKNRMPVSV